MTIISLSKHYEVIYLHSFTDSRHPLLGSMVLKNRR